MECTGCGLCLKIIENNNFVVLEEAHKNMLQILVPKINWSTVIYGQQMCQECSENLQKTYLFKSYCLKNNEKVEVLKMLGEILVMRNQLCCLCCEGYVCEDLAGTAKVNLKEMVYRCFPQLTFSSDNMGSCEKCFSSLKDLDTFVNCCLEIEENIKSYCSTMHIDCKDFNINEYIKRKNCSTISTEHGMELTEDMEEPNKINLLQTEGDEKDSNNSDGNSIEQVKLVDGKNKLKNKKSQLLEKFQCDKCDYVAKYKYALVSHMVKHKDPTKTKMHRCEECGHETKRIGDLRWHMIIHKDPEEVKTYHCANCPYKTKRKGDLKQHVVMHMRHTFKCALCSFETKNKVYLDTIHILVHKDRSELKTYKCESCLYETINKYHMKLHSKVHKDPSELKKFKCNWCEFETTNRKGIRDHQYIHKCKSELQMYKCNFCEYEAKQKAFLKSHMLKHINSSVTYDCSKCAYKAKRKNYLRKHIQSMHKDPSQIRMYKCDMCSYQGKRKETLKKHMYSHIRSLQALNDKQGEIKEILFRIQNMSKT